MSVLRITNCHPFGGSGYDPVKKKLKRNFKWVIKKNLIFGNCNICSNNIYISNFVSVQTPTITSSENIGRNSASSFHR